MVSWFVEEYSSHLALTPEEHKAAKAKYLTIQSLLGCSIGIYGNNKEGYWMGEKFMVQMKNACDIAESKYGCDKHTIVFVFDQNSCHKKFDEKVLDPKNIQVKDDGPCRVCSRRWAGKPQAMVHPDANGLRTVSAERGINTEMMKADDMRMVLANRDDFMNEKTDVEHYDESRGPVALFLPKLYYELNLTEHVWGHSKHYC